jgi:hypothetical protein
VDQPVVGIRREGEQHVGEVLDDIDALPTGGRAAADQLRSALPVEGGEAGVERSAWRWIASHRPCSRRKR